MSVKPVENLVYEFLAEHQADFGSLVEIHPSAYEKWNKNAGIIIGDADTSMLPNGDGDEVTEFDGLLTLEFYARVEGQDKTQRLPARQKVFDLKKKTIQLFEEFPTLNNRGCQVQILRQARFFDDTRGDKYCTERLPIVINPKDFRGE